LDLPICSNNNGMDENSEDSLLFDDVEVAVDGNRPATPTMFAATRLSARPCIPEISRVAANIGRLPTNDVDAHDTPFGEEEQEVKYYSASVPTLVSVIPRSPRTRTYVDAASAEMMADLGPSVADQSSTGRLPTKDADSQLTPFGEEQEVKYHSASVPTMVSIIPRSSRTRKYVDPASAAMMSCLGSSVANQSSVSGLRCSSESEPEMYLDDSNHEVFFGESNDNEPERGGIVLVETYDDIEAQASPWSMNHSNGDPTTTMDVKTLSQNRATTWIIANKTLLILILLVTSAAILAAILGLLVAKSIRERSQSD
jgi:hypothetical protein